jgi:hypothetical protein
VKAEFVVVTPVIASADEPVFVSVTFSALLVLVVPKFKSMGTSFTVPVVSLRFATAFLVASETAAARKSTVEPLGTDDGAVYVVGESLAVLVGEAEPQAAQLLPLNSTVQSIPLLSGSYCTVPLKFSADLRGISAEMGETVTLIANTVMPNPPDLLESSIEVAVTVTSSSADGAVAGATYVADVVVMLVREPDPLAGDKDHVTPCLLRS